MRGARTPCPALPLATVLESQPGWGGSPQLRAAQESELSAAVALTGTAFADTAFAFAGAFCSAAARVGLACCTSGAKAVGQPISKQKATAACTAAKKHQIVGLRGF